MSQLFPVGLALDDAFYDRVEERNRCDGCFIDVRSVNAR